MSQSKRKDPLESVLVELRELKGRQRLIESNLRFLEKQYPNSILVKRKLDEELGQIIRAIVSKEQTLKNLGYR